MLASANFNPWTEAKVDTKNPERGPLLIMCGETDHTVAWAIANASYKLQQENQNPTELIRMAGRGHTLTIDSGWQEVADTALQFVGRYVHNPSRSWSLRVILGKYPGDQSRVSCGDR